jgi:phage shock protein C
MRDWFRKKGLVRPRRGRILGGVCAAFARSNGWSPWLVRLAAVLSILIPGPQVLAYVVLWILLPAEE